MSHPFIRAATEAALILVGLTIFHLIYGRVFRIIVTDGTLALMSVAAVAYVVVRAITLEKRSPQ